MKHEQVYPRCPVCQKAVYPTWSAAQRALDDMTRQRKAARGFRVYHSRHCSAIHIGAATSKTRARKMREAERRYA